MNTSMRLKSYICIATFLGMTWAIMPLAFAAETPDLVPASQKPETTSAPTPAPSATMGQKLFESICAHCHQTTYDESRIGAPGLRGVLDRHDEAWLNNWIKGPETFAQSDVAARDLIDGNRFGLAMPTIPAMQSEENRKAVIEYLKTLK